MDGVHRFIDQLNLPIVADDAPCLLLLLIHVQAAGPVASTAFTQRCIDRLIVGPALRSERHV